MQAKKVLLSSLHEDVANKEDGGLKRMLGEDEEIAKKREASMNRLRMLEKVQLTPLLHLLASSIPDAVDLCSIGVKVCSCSRTHQGITSADANFSTNCLNLRPANEFFDDSWQDLHSGVEEKTSREAMRPALYTWFQYSHSIQPILTRF